MSHSSQPNGPEVPREQRDRIASQSTEDTTSYIAATAAAAFEDIPELTRDEFEALNRAATKRRANTKPTGTPSPRQTPCQDARVRRAPTVAYGGKVQLNVRIPAQLKNAIIAIAQTQNCEVSEVVAAALVAHAGQNGGQP